LLVFSPLIFFHPRLTPPRFCRRLSWFGSVTNLEVPRLLQVHLIVSFLFFLTSPGTFRDIPKSFILPFARAVVLDERFHAVMVLLFACGSPLSFDPFLFWLFPYSPSFLPPLLGLILVCRSTHLLFVFSFSYSDLIIPKRSPLMPSLPIPLPPFSFCFLVFSPTSTCFLSRYGYNLTSLRLLPSPCVFFISYLRILLYWIRLFSLMARALFCTPGLFFLQEFFIFLLHPLFLRFILSPHIERSSPLCLWFFLWKDRLVFFFDSMPRRTGPLLVLLFFSLPLLNIFAILPFL